MCECETIIVDFRMRSRSHDGQMRCVAMYRHIACEKGVFSFVAKIIFHFSRLSVFVRCACIHFVCSPSCLSIGGCVSAFPCIRACLGLSFARC